MKEIEKYYRRRIKNKYNLFNLIDVKNFIRVININNENCLIFHIQPELTSSFFEDFTDIFPEYSK